MLTVATVKLHKNYNFFNILWKTKLPHKSSAKDILFEWQHQRISSTDLKQVKVTKHTAITLAFCDTTTGFPAKWCLRNACRNSILMVTSDWLKQISLMARPISSTTQISIGTHHQYVISALFLQSSIPFGVGVFQISGSGMIEGFWGGWNFLFRDFFG